MGDGSVVLPSGFVMIDVPMFLYDIHLLIHIQVIHLQLATCMHLVTFLSKSNLQKRKNKVVCKRANTVCYTQWQVY